MSESRVLGAAPAALAAGAWLGPGLAVLAGLGLLRLAGAVGGFPDVLAVVALSLLAGAPVAALAGLLGSVGVGLGLAAVAAGGAALGLFMQLDGQGMAMALPFAAAAAGLVTLWAGLAVAAGQGLSPLRGLLAGIVLAVAVALLARGAQAASAWAFWGLALGAAVAGLVALVPAATGRPRPATLWRSLAPPLAGLALALAVLAGPAVALLLNGPLMARLLALGVAVPGLALVALARGLAGFRLATLLLALQALAVVLGLAMGAAPVAAGLIPMESLPAFRMALLGAAFLPAFAALQAMLLGRARLLPAILSALLLALLSAGLGPALALAEPRFAPYALLFAPVLGTFLTWLMVLREESGDV